MDDMDGYCVNYLELLWSLSHWEPELSKRPNILCEKVGSVLPIFRYWQDVGNRSVACRLLVGDIQPTVSGVSLMLWERGGEAGFTATLNFSTELCYKEDFPLHDQTRRPKSPTQPASFKYRRMAMIKIPAVSLWVSSSTGHPSIMWVMEDCGWIEIWEFVSRSNLV